jgi:hypothetical protein
MHKYPDVKSRGAWYGQSMKDDKEVENERLRHAEQALRARIVEFRAGDRLSRDAAHERRADVAPAPASEPHS